MPSAPTNSNTVAPGSNQRPEQGTGFVNVQDILNANQGNQLGNVLSGGQQNDLTSFNNQLDTAQSGFEDQATQSQNQLNTDQNDINNVLNVYNTDPELKYNQSSSLNTPANQNKTDQFNAPVVQGQSGDSQIINGVNGGPSADARFQQYMTATYGGPQGLDASTQQSLSTQGQNLDQFNVLNSTDAGRQALLGQYINNPAYTQDQQALDSTLYQASPGAGQSAGNKYINHANQVNSANTADQGYAGALTGGYSQLNPSIQTAVGNAITGENTNYTNLVNNFNTGSATKYGNLQADLTSGNLSAADLQALGLSGNTTTYGIKNQLGTFVSPTQNINMNQALTEGDRAKMIGLQGLLGQTPSVEDLATAKANGDALNTSTYAQQYPTSSLTGAGPSPTPPTTNPSAIPSGAPIPTVGLPSFAKLNSTGWDTALQNAQNTWEKNVDGPLTNPGAVAALSNIFVPQGQINPAKDIQDPYSGILGGSPAGTQPGYQPNNQTANAYGQYTPLPNFTTGESLGQYDSALNAYSALLNQAQNDWQTKYGGVGNSTNDQPVPTPGTLGKLGQTEPNSQYTNYQTEAPVINSLFAARQSEVQQAQQAYQAQLAALQQLYGGHETLGQAGFSTPPSQS